MGGGGGGTTMYQGNSDPKQMFLFPPSQSVSRSSKTLKGRGGYKERRC